MTPAAIHKELADSAILNGFNVVKKVSLEKVKKKTHRLCDDIGLSKLSRDIRKGEKALNIFFGLDS